MNNIKTEMNKFFTWVNQDGDDCKLEQDVIKICKNLFEQHIEFIFQQGASTAINNWSNKWGLSEDYKNEKEEFIKHFLNRL